MIRSRFSHVGLHPILRRKAPATSGSARGVVPLGSTTESMYRTAPTSCEAYAMNARARGGSLNASWARPWAQEALTDGVEHGAHRIQRRFHLPQVGPLQRSRARADGLSEVRMADAPISPVPGERRRGDRFPHESIDFAPEGRIFAQVREALDGPIVPRSPSSATLRRVRQPGQAQHQVTPIHPLNLPEQPGADRVQEFDGVRVAEELPEVLSPSNARRRRATYRIPSEGLGFRPGPGRRGGGRPPRAEGFPPPPGCRVQEWWVATLWESYDLL